MFKREKNKTKLDRSRKYYKILNSNMGNPIYIQYQEGLNVYPNFNPEKYRGIYFTNIESIFAYLNYGPIVAEITIPESSVVIECGERRSIYGEFIDGWFADRIIIDKLMYLNELNTFKYLIDSGALIDIDKYQLIKYALLYNKELFEYLKSDFPDDDFDYLIMNLFRNF